jgi:hypothetical protein
MRWLISFNCLYRSVSSLSGYPKELNLVREDEMGRACSTNGGRREMYIEYFWESQEERSTGKTMT